MFTTCDEIFGSLVMCDHFDLGTSEIPVELVAPSDDTTVVMVRPQTRIAGGFESHNVTLTCTVLLTGKSGLVLENQVIQEYSELDRGALAMRARILSGRSELFTVTHCCAHCSQIPTIVQNRLRERELEEDFESLHNVPQDAYRGDW
jgi:hypothetical protein